MGHPTKKTPEMIAAICEQIANSSKGLREIAASVGTTREAILRWLREDEEFRTRYTRAKEDQADFMAEEMLIIADDGTNDDIETESGTIPNHEWMARARLRVDTRKFLMSKLLPKKYGDKLDITSDGEKIQSPTINVQPPE